MTCILSIYKNKICCFAQQNTHYVHSNIVSDSATVSICLLCLPIVWLLVINTQAFSINVMFLVFCLFLF